MLHFWFYIFYETTHIHKRKKSNGRNGGNHENEKYKDRYHKPKIQIFPFLAISSYCLLLLYIYFLFVCFGKKIREYKTQTHIHVKLNLNSELLILIDPFLYLYMFILLCYVFCLSVKFMLIYAIFAVEIYLAFFPYLLLCFSTKIKQEE